MSGQAVRASGPGKVFFVVMEPGVPECDWIFPSLKLQVRTILSLPLLEFFIHMMGRAFSRWASPHPIPAGKRCQCSNRMGMRCIYCTGSETNSIISENWTAWVTWRRIIDFVVGYYVLRDTVDKFENWKKRLPGSWNSPLPHCNSKTRFLTTMLML